MGITGGGFVDCRIIKGTLKSGLFLPAERIWNMKSSTLVLLLIFFTGFSGCLKVKDSGQKTQYEHNSVSENEKELDSLRVINRRLRKENEELKTINAGMQAKQKNLEKRDVKLSQKIKELEADLRQRILIAKGLLSDKNELLEKNKELEAKIKELQAGPDAQKKQTTPTADAIP